MGGETASSTGKTRALGSQDSLDQDGKERILRVLIRPSVWETTKVDSMMPSCRNEHLVASRSNFRSLTLAAAGLEEKQHGRIKLLAIQC